MDNRLSEIALGHGLDEQLEQTIEECAELIVAIQDYKRFGKKDDGFETYYLAKIAEEVVDVRIMTEQLKMLIEGFDFETHKTHQIERELVRMRGELNGERGICENH